MVCSLRKNFNVHVSRMLFKRDFWNCSMVLVIIIYVNTKYLWPWLVYVCVCVWLDILLFVQYKE